MEIFNDAPNRIVLLGHRDEEELPAFDTRTRAGAYLYDLLGVPLSSMFATANVLPAREVRYIVGRRLGAEARELLGHRRVIVVGKDTAQLMCLPHQQVLEWTSISTTYLNSLGDKGGVRRLPPLEVAQFPTPGPRSHYWQNTQLAEHALAWLAEQGEMWKNELIESA